MFVSNKKLWNSGRPPPPRYGKFHTSFFLSNPSLMDTGNLFNRRGFCPVRSVKTNFICAINSYCDRKFILIIGIVINRME